MCQARDQLVTISYHLWYKQSGITGHHRVCNIDIVSCKSLSTEVLKPNILVQEVVLWFMVDGGGFDKL